MLLLFAAYTSEYRPLIAIDCYHLVPTEALSLNTLSNGTQTFELKLTKPALITQNHQTRPIYDHLNGV